MPKFAAGALDLAFEGDRARLTLCRPDRRNALNAAMWRALPLVAAAVDEEPGVKVLTVAGMSGNFAAGADIAEFETACATPELAGQYAAAVHDGLLAFSRMAKPTVAVIEGFCIGGGVALALACDIRLAADDARFAVTPAKLGIVYNIFDTRLLVDAVGASAARDILFTGRIIDAQRALRLGLIDDAVSPRELSNLAEARCALICANSAYSVREAKKMVRRALDGQAVDDAITREVSVRSFTGRAFDKGRAAFLAKEAPDFGDD